MSSGLTPEKLLSLGFKERAGTMNRIYYQQNETRIYFVDGRALHYPSGSTIPTKELLDISKVLRRDAS